MKRWLSSPLLILGAVAAAACVGSIEDGDGKTGGGGTGGGPTISPTGRDPGRVTLHRLNRSEYDNTVKDLLGTSLTPAKDFPADDHGFGFDNIADVLSLSPTQVELVERAADKLIEDAMKPPSALSTVTRIEAETLTGTVGGATADAYNLWSNGDIDASFSLPSDGKYEVRAQVWATQAGPDPAKMSMRIGAKDLGTFDVPNVKANPLIVSAQADVTSGSKIVTVSFLNDFYQPPDDRNLYVDWIEVEGPLGVTTASSASRDRILICDLVTGGDACVRDILTAFAKRAWRRPPTTLDIDKLMPLVALAKAEGEDTEAGLKLALRAILVSPRFLFRFELDPNPNGGVVRPLDDWELASRLSYFLWSSMPDDDLFLKAEAGELTNPDTLVAEAKRLLADPKSKALTDNFAGQWLYTRALIEHEPDYNYFPSYDDGLRVAMENETRLFFEEFLTTPQPVEGLLTANFAWLDQRLAQHYGLTGPTGSTPQKLSLKAGLRGGLLGQGSILTITSYPTRTSPVKRGRWVLAQLLCSNPKDPPPGVEGNLPDTTPAGTTQKELLAKHREDPECAICHDEMDPVGIGLENFDAIGGYRTDEGGIPVDPTGILPDGTPITGAASLSAAIAADPRFPACVLTQMFTYALGRGPTADDDAYFDEMMKNLGGGGFTLEQAILEIIKSEPFRMRRSEGGGS